MISLGRQAGSLRSGEVQPVADEFHQGDGFGGSGEKWGEGIAQRHGHDQLGGGQTRAHGAHPGAERASDQLGRGGGEDLEQALGDETELDMAMVGEH